MGRFADLCGVVAESAEEGAEGLILLPETWDSLRKEWSDEEIEDALGVVHETILQGELVDSADSLCGRLMEALAPFAEPAAFREAESAGASLSLDTIGQIARRVARLEEVLTAFRDSLPIDRRGFDRLYERLMNRGIEDEMEPQIFDPPPLREGGEDEEDV